MTIKRMILPTGLSVIALVAMMLACGRAQEGSSEQKQTKQQGNSQKQAEVDLHPPPEYLAVDVTGMTRLSPKHEVWLDRKGKRVILGGEICQRFGQLEMLVTTEGGKTHESVVAVKSEAFIIHAALLALGAKPGSPVQFRPKFKPASGTEVEVFFLWTDSAEKTHKLRGQEWARKVQTQQMMKESFVFAGSIMTVDPNTKQQRYEAEGGDLICVSNFPTAMLDIPVKSTDQASGLLYEGFGERIPPEHTPVTVILKPKLEK